MEKEEIIEIVTETVSKKFGEDKIKKLNAFGPYEGEDLNIDLYIKGINENEATELWKELKDRFWKLDLDVPIAINKAEES